MAIQTNSYRVVQNGRFTVDDTRTAYAIAGAEAGVLSGVVMLLAMMVYTAAIGEGFLFPTQQIAATFLGVEALIGGVGTAVLGVITHLVVAAVWGGAFGLLLSPLASTSAATGWGLAFGVGVWLTMTFIGLPIFDPVMSDRVSLYTGWWFAFHLLFGGVLGTTPEIARQMLVRETVVETYRRAA